MIVLFRPRIDRDMPNPIYALENYGHPDPDTWWYETLDSKWIPPLYHQFSIRWKERGEKEFAEIPVYVANDERFETGYKDVAIWRVTLKRTNGRTNATLS